MLLFFINLFKTHNLLVCISLSKRRLCWPNAKLDVSVISSRVEGLTSGTRRWGNTLRAFQRAFLTARSGCSRKPVCYEERRGGEGGRWALPLNAVGFLKRQKRTDSLISSPAADKKGLEL